MTKLRHGENFIQPRQKGVSLLICTGVSLPSGPAIRVALIFPLSYNLKTSESSKGLWAGVLLGLC